MKSPTANLRVTAQPVAGIFFPQRPGSRLTAHHFSPAVLAKLVRSSARQASFQEAADALEDLAEVTVSSRRISRVAHEVGHQMQAERDNDVNKLQARELKSRVETRPAPAVVGVDGGRLQIRGAGDGPGAHDSSWREDKISVLATAAVTASDADPEPDLPECFRNRKWLKMDSGVVVRKDP